MRLACLPLFVALTLALPLTAAGLDLKFLDYLAPKASENTTINLDGDQIRNFLNSSKDKAKSGKEDSSELLKNITRVQVRTFEFKERNAYSEKDLATLRAEVRKLVSCDPMIQNVGKDELQEIFLCRPNPEAPQQIAVISAEPRELTVVYVEGRLDLGDIFKAVGEIEKIANRH